MNHINMEKLNELMEAVRRENTNAKITPKVSGKWIFEDG